MDGFQLISGRRRASWRAWLASIALGLAVPYPAEATLNAPIAAPVAESYKLPISPPADQGDSDLCWVYATLNMLETNYLQKHPRSTIALSRGALQRESIADRFRREIAGGPAYLEDGGVAVDAISLIRRDGLVADRDFHGVVDSDPIFTSISARLSDVAGQSRKVDALDKAIASRLGAAPVRTKLDGAELTPEQLAKTVLGDDVWTEYDVSQDGVDRVGPAPDPDARPGTAVHFVPLATAIDLIHASLARGQSVVWGSTDNHALLIYGGDYDASGRPLAYWIKDSFAPYSYRAAAGDIHRILTDVTVASPPPQPTSTTAVE